MNALWQITIDDYIEIIKRAKANGKCQGDSMEKEILSYMKEKNQKPFGHTELNQEEFLKEQASHGRKVLSMEIKDGKTVFKTINKGSD